MLGELDAQATGTLQRVTTGALAALGLGRDAPRAHHPGRDRDDVVLGLTCLPRTPDTEKVLQGYFTSDSQESASIHEVGYVL